jgi:hypothetical protein
MALTPPPRVVVHSRAVGQLLKSPAVAALLREMGESIASAAGPGHEVQVDQGPNRARVEVSTATFEAMRAEAHNRTLTSSIDAGRR